MIFKFWMTILVFVPSVALAQAPAPSAPAEKTLTEPHYENDCTRFYPAAAAKLGAEGVTVVSVHVTADGAVASPRVVETSGNADLDKAALTCLSGARIKPLTAGGTPIPADSQIRVVWQRSFFSGAPAPREPNACPMFYPPLALRMNHQGDAMVSFTIAEDGTAKNVAIKKTSGYGELDQASLTCVSGFRYWPVTQNGSPVAVDSTTTVKWHLRQ